MDLRQHNIETWTIIVFTLVIDNRRLTTNHYEKICG